MSDLKVEITRQFKDIVEKLIKCSKNREFNRQFFEGDPDEEFRLALGKLMQLHPLFSADLLNIISRASRDHALKLLLEIQDEEISDENNVLISKYIFSKFEKQMAQFNLSQFYKSIPENPELRFEYLTFLTQHDCIDIEKLFHGLETEGYLFKKYLDVSAENLKLKTKIQHLIDDQVTRLKKDQ